MAFAGTELLEVAPSAAISVVEVGDYVIAASGSDTAIMDCTTGKSLLYGATPNAGSWMAPRSYDGAGWFGSRYKSNAVNNRWYVIRVDVDGTVTQKGTGTSGQYYDAFAVDDTYVYIARTTYGTPFKMLMYPLAAPVNGTPPEVLYNGAAIPGFPYVTQSGRLFILNGTSLTEFTTGFVSQVGAWTLPLAASVNVTEYNGRLIFPVASTSVAYVWFDLSTGAVGQRVVTPTGIPSNSTRWACLNNVAHRIESDNTKMCAVDMATGQWVVDDLVTVRSARPGVVAAKGSLWIPTTVTP